MKKIKFSNISFYVFTLCMMVIAAIVLSVTFSCLLSGYQLSAHGQFRMWMTIFAFLTIGALAFVRLLLDFGKWAIDAYHDCFLKDDNNEANNPNNTGNTLDIDNTEYMS